MSTRYGYLWVNTLWEMTDENRYEVQRKALEDAGADDFVEDCSLGAQVTRPKLPELMNTLITGDTLIVTRLGILARTAQEGYDLIIGLINRSISVRILDMGWINNSEAGQILLRILSAFTKFEKEKHAERAQTGKVVARRQGKCVDGRPKKFTPEQFDHAMRLLLEEKQSYDDVAKVTGISKRTLHRERQRRAGSCQSSRVKSILQTANELYNMLKDPSVRKDVAKWEDVVAQLIDLSSQEASNMRIATLLAKGLAYPPAINNLEKQKRHLAILAEKNLFFGKNIAIAEAYAQGLADILIYVQELEKKEGFIKRLVLLAFGASESVFISEKLTEGMVIYLKEQPIEDRENYSKHLDLLSVGSRNHEMASQVLTESYKRLKGT